MLFIVLPAVNNPDLYNSGSEIYILSITIALAPPPPLQIPAQP